MSAPLDNSLMLRKESVSQKLKLNVALNLISVVNVKFGKTATALVNVHPTANQIVNVSMAWSVTMTLKMKQVENVFAPLILNAVQRVTVQRNVVHSVMKLAINVLILNAVMTVIVGKMHVHKKYKLWNFKCRIGYLKTRHLQ